jgi:prepilin-type processing-associated H-X9-DG protein
MRVGRSAISISHITNALVFLRMISSYAPMTGQSGTCAAENAHVGGVNFLFADGSVRTFQYNIDRTFQGLLTPAGGNDPTPPEG